MATDILIIGSGAREHALAWKLSQSKRVGQIYVAQGNAGTGTFCINVDISPRDLPNLVSFASEKRIGLTIVGPDEPLALGVVDLFKKSGLRIFGPSKAAAQIESSKLFAKQLMQEAHVPTAAYRSFADVGQAVQYAGAMSYPLVVKANGLAAGKGVVICATKEEALAAIDSIMIQKQYGDAGKEVIIEEYMPGEEISIHALTDGVNCLMFPPSQDHKRIGEGNTGKNTGGMGAVAPVRWVTEPMMIEIEQKIIKPIITALGNRGTPFQGVLFPGVMMTPQGPKVIELNARFGDPECQAYMRLIESDLLDVIDDCVDGGVGAHAIRWASAGAVNVVLASAGYPDDFRSGHIITGIPTAEQNPNVVVFHAGTVYREHLETSGGRVLSVSATGTPMARALELVYKAADEISFEGKYLRRDIGVRELG